MVSKITSPVSPLDVITKINNIIDDKQDKLTSGTNIKTVNNNSLLGSGNITISSTPSIDNSTITNNSSNQLQTVAVKDNRSGNAIKTWTGTKAQYDAITTKDANTLYNITDDTDVTLSLLELLYPVGAIYIGTCASCPLQVLGVGTWQLIASDRVLQGAGTRGIVGDTLEAGLPNITSGTDWLNSTGGTLTNATNATPSLDGCFDGASTGGHGISSNNYSIYWSRIDASRSSTIYKNDVTTVQPPAYIVNIWERTA